MRHRMWLALLLTVLMAAYALPSSAGTAPIHTSELRMTGRAYQPQTIKPGELRMTGRAIQPVTINTNGLKMIGNAYRPVTISTSGLHMTGNK